MPDVTTIIPTMAEEKRRHSLLRAIESILAASVNPVQILVVVNGNRRSPEVLGKLRALDNVRIFSLETGSLPLAILAGRREVQTPYFCFLDDDDEYLPHAIDLRLAPMRSNEKLDFVVTNGYRCIDGNDTVCFSGLDHVASSPFEALFKENWLASCGSLFRSDRVGAEYFEDPHAFVEWTWLAFKLCMDKKLIGVVDAPTFRVHDTPASASKSTDYCAAMHPLYQRMLASQPPRFIASIIRSRIGSLLHSESDSFRKQGKFLEAWGAHLKSLCYPRGWRYLAFSRHLLSIRRQYPWQTDSNQGNTDR